MIEVAHMLSQKWGVEGYRRVPATIQGSLRVTGRGGSGLTCAMAVDLGIYRDHLVARVAVCQVSAAYPAATVRNLDASRGATSAVAAGRTCTATRHCSPM